MFWPVIKNSFTQPRKRSDNDVGASTIAALVTLIFAAASISSNSKLCWFSLVPVIRTDLPRSNCSAVCPLSRLEGVSPLFQITKGKTIRVKFQLVSSSCHYSLQPHQEISGARIFNVSNEIGHSNARYTATDIPFCRADLNAASTMTSAFKASSTGQKRLALPSMLSARLLYIS